MKKILATVLALGMVLTFTACGKSSELKIGQVEAAAHGTKCFTIATAVVEDDKIVAAYIDEFQFLSAADAQGVPNSDSDFGTNYADASTSVLASKRTNADMYSKNMAEKGGSTVRIDDNFDAIEDYCVGKTISELEKILGEKDANGMIDAVSGATLVDAHGYVSAVLAAAKAAK